MVSLKEVLTKDVRPIKTMPNRRPGLASGFCYSVTALLAIILIFIFFLFEIRPRFFLTLASSQVLAIIIYDRWVEYAKSQESAIGRNFKNVSNK